VIYAFGDLELDLERFEFRRGPEICKVEPPALSLRL
jgi:hypothetical protein